MSVFSPVLQLTYSCFALLYFASLCRRFVGTIGSRLGHSDATVRRRAKLRRTELIALAVYEMDTFPKNRRWYSHKFKAAGVRYEVGVCIQTGARALYVWSLARYQHLQAEDETVLVACRLARWLLPTEAVRETGVLGRQDRHQNHGESSCQA